MGRAKARRSELFPRASAGEIDGITRPFQASAGSTEERGHVGTEDSGFFGAMSTIESLEAQNALRRSIRPRALVPSCPRSCFSTTSQIELQKKRPEVVVKRHLRHPTARPTRRTHCATLAATTAAIVSRTATSLTLDSTSPPKATVSMRRASGSDTPRERR